MEELNGKFLLEFTDVVCRGELAGKTLSTDDELIYTENGVRYGLKVDEIVIDAVCTENKSQPTEFEKFIYDMLKDNFYANVNYRNEGVEADFGTKKFLFNVYKK